MSIVVYLVRHAEPVVKEGKKLGLTSTGIGQAKSLAMSFEGKLDRKSGITILHASSDRCVETAGILGKALGVASQEAPLRLRNAGNLKIDVLQSKLVQYMANYSRLGIESPDAYAIRILRLVKEQSSGTVIVVGNEVPLLLLGCQIAGNTMLSNFQHGSSRKFVIENKKSK